MVRDVRACTLVLVLGMTACVDAPESAEAEPTTLADTKPPTPFIVENVAASGTGCPAGSWTATPTRAPTSILRPEESGDPVIRLAFTSYAVALSTQLLHATLDCRVTVEIDAQQDIAFAPRQLQPSGFADGLRVDLAWEGVPASAQSLAISTVSAVALRDARWSGCGGLQTLQVVTALDGNYRDWDRTINLDRLDITLLPRRCPKPAADAGSDTVRDAETDAAVADAAAPSDEDVVPAREISLREISLNPRCPWKGEFELAAQEDQITMLFDSFALPQSQSFTPSSELCWFKFRGSLPQGYEVAVGSFAAHGEASLPPGVSLALAGGAVARNNVGDELVVPADAQRHLVSGPHEGAFTVAHTFHGPDLRFSGCNSREIPFALSAEVLGTPLPADGSVRVERIGPIAFVMRPCKK